MDGIWSIDPPETIALWVAAIVVLGFAAVITDSLYPVPIQRFDPLDAWSTKRVELEAARVNGIAKAIATTAAGFLTALLAALLKNDIAATVSAWSLIGLLCGVLGALTAAAQISIRARRFISAPGGGS